MRSSAISALKESDPHPYPHKFHVTMSLPAFMERYQGLEEGEYKDEDISVAGYIELWTIIIGALHLQASNPRSPVFS